MHAARLLWRTWLTLRREGQPGCSRLLLSTNLSDRCCSSVTQAQQLATTTTGRCTAIRVHRALPTLTCGQWYRGLSAAAGDGGGIEAGVSVGAGAGIDANGEGIDTCRTSLPVDQSKQLQQNNTLLAELLEAKPEELIGYYEELYNAGEAINGEVFPAVFAAYVRRGNGPRAQGVLRNHRLCRSHRSMVNFMTSARKFLSSTEMGTAEVLMREHFIEVQKTFHRGGEEQEKRDYESELAALMLEVYVAAENYERALKMVDVLEEHKAGLNMLDTCRALAVLVKAKEHDRALRYLQDRNNALVSLLSEEKDLDSVYLGAPLDKNEREMLRSLIQQHIQAMLQEDRQDLREEIKKMFRPFSDDKKARLDAAMRLFERMHAFMAKLDDKTYCVFLAGFYRHDRFDQAMSVWERYECSHSKPTMIIYTIMIEGLSKRLDIRSAETFWHRIKNDGMTPDSMAYYAMIEAYFRARRYKDGIALFDEMVDNRIPIDVTGYNRIVNGLLWTHKIDAAFRIYQRMLNSGDERQRPNMTTYNTLLRGALFAREHAHAARVLTDMRKQGIQLDAVTLTTIIDRLFAIRDYAGAVKIWNMFKLLGIKPNVVSYGAIIGGLIRFGDIPAAQRMFHEMLEERIRPSVQLYTIMIQGFFYRNMVDLAIQTYQQMLEQRIEPTAGTYNVMIGGYIAAGRLEDALGIYNRMKASYTKPTQATYQALLDGCIHHGNMQTASNVYDDMTNVKFQPSLRLLVENCRLVERWRKTYGHGTIPDERVQSVQSL